MVAHWLHWTSRSVLSTRTRNAHDTRNEILTLDYSNEAGATSKVVTDPPSFCLRARAKAKQRLAAPNNIKQTHIIMTSSFLSLVYNCIIQVITSTTYKRQLRLHVVA